MLGPQFIALKTDPARHLVSGQKLRPQFIPRAAEGGGFALKLAGEVGHVLNTKAV